MQKKKSSASASNCKTSSKNPAKLGEMNYARIAEVLREVSYAGDVGLEAFPAGDSDKAIERFREIFS